MTPSFQERNVRLLELLNLTPAEVDANRNGSISPNQYDRIAQQLQVVWRRLGYFFVGMTLVPIVIALVFSQPVVQFAFTLLAISSVFFFLRLWLQIRPQQATVRRDLNQNAVASIEGSAHKSIENENDYYIGIKEERFLVYPDVYHLIDVNAPIGIYYLANSRKLLSVEYLLPFVEENMTL